MKRWICVKCDREILGYIEDVELKNFGSCAEISISSYKGISHECTFEMVREWTNSTMHGEAGWMTEGTMLDSMSTIHDGESHNIHEAEGFRELKQLNDGMKCM